MRSVLVRFGFGFIVFAIMIGVLSRNDLAIAFSKPVDIYVDFPQDYYDVKAVDTELYMLVDLFAEEEVTKTTSSGTVTARNFIYYYIVPVYTEDDVFYVGVKVNKDKSGSYEKVLESTWAYMNYETDAMEESVAFTGGFTKMDDELYEYFEDWFVESEFFESEEEMNAHILPLLLEPMVFQNVRIAAYVMIGFLVIGIIMLFFGLRRSK